ncbi:phage holin family protein [Gordonia sp. PDNC005]|uniref:phage holin family protein n=1 Tax=unclassified Gordonia (in: high G+C Gram-positive bacteria) TaxID=2657482 RepID=UPI00196449E2|nr:phage holin family protein [Gordonia sp. PDNC005]QRY62665.1 phage holin family protein [Gordonia sp. PDNC005]
MSGNQDTWPPQPADAPRVPSIPLSDANLGPDGEPTIGNLVKDATASASTLFRAELALAKSELVTEAKKAGAGSGLIIGAAVLLLYASLFFFVFLGFLLDVWLPTWAAFGIVFLLLLVVSIAAIGVGYILFKKLKAPEKTIESLNSITEVIPGRPASTGGVAHPQIPPARDPMAR